MNSDRLFPNDLRNLQSFISVKDYGAKGDGRSDDTNGIQKAIDFAYASGGKTVIIPYTKNGYNLYRPIRIKKGVKLISNLAKINRKFSRTVSGWAIFLEGDNTIVGLDYDGGSDVIPVDLESNEFIYYADFSTDGAAGPVWIQNCKLSNSCGSYVLGNSDNIFITNNVFGEYLDHALYFGGRNTGAGVISENITINGNVFNALNSTREAIKARNGVKNYVLNDNILNLDKGAFCTFDIGDSSLPAIDNQNVTVTGNTGYCPRFVAVGGRDNTAILNNLSVTSNNVICTNEVLFLGNTPGTTDQKGCSIKNATIDGNTFRTSRQFAIINGDITNMIDMISITNNSIVYGDATEILFQLFGNINFLRFEGNTVKCNRSTFSTGSYFKPTVLYSYMNFFPTIKGTLRIHNNTFIGEIQSIIADNTNTSSNNQSSIVWNLDLDGNTMISNNNKIPVNITGSLVSNITTTCTIRNTTYIGGGTVGKNQFKLTNLIDNQNPTAFSVGLSSQQTLPNSFTKINFGNKEFDNRNEFDPVNSRFTVTQSGVYQATVSVECSAVTDGGQATLSIYKNGTEYRRLAMEYFNTTANQTVTGSALLNLVAGDYIEAYILTPQGSVTLINNAPRTYFQVLKI